MKKEAYQQYLDESESWLNKGRRMLLDSIVETYVHKEGDGKKMDILEIGAGSGKGCNILSAYGVVDAVEIEPMAIELLRENCKINKIYNDMIPLPLDKQYDLIVAMDVVEHIEDDQDALTWMMGQLRPGGYMFLTVPAYQWMFSTHDTALNHYRRYTEKSFRSVIPSEADVLFAGYFNCLLFPLAAISRILLKLKNRSGNPLSESKQSSALPPIVDKFFFQVLKFESLLVKKKLKLPWGLTVVLVCQKSK